MSNARPQSTSGRRLSAGRVFRALLNTGLATLLAVQVSLLIWLLPDGEVRIPQALLRKAQAKLAAQDIRLDTADIEIDLRGYLSLRQPSLTLLSSHETIFEADHILIGFRPWTLIFGKISLDDIRIINGTLFGPAVISPTGTREPVCENLFVSAQSFGRWWNIDRINADLVGVRIAVAGPIPHSILDADPSEAPSPGLPDPSDLRSRYEQACRKLIELGEQLKPLDQPLILAQLDQESATGAGIALYAQVNKTAPIAGLTLGASSLSARLNLGRDHILRAETPASLAIYDIHYADRLHADRAELKVVLAHGPKGVLDIPPGARLFLYRPISQGLTFDAAMLLASYRSMEEVRVHAALKSLHNWLDIVGTVNPKAEAGLLTLNSHWDPAFFLQAAAFKEMQALPDVRFATLPRFTAHVRFSEGWVFEDTRMELESGPASYESLHLDALYTKAYLRPGHLQLSETSLYAPDYTVTGSYWQDLETNDYRFLIEGKVRPTDISFIVDESWWDELWADFTFPDKLPRASLDLRGRYHGGDTNRFMFCRAQLPACTYREIPVDTATAWLFQTPEVLDIIDLDVRAGQHAALANIQFLYTPGQENRRSLGFTGVSDLPLDSLAALIGPEATPYRALFSTREPPSLRAAGMVYGEDSPHADELTLKIQAHFPGETLFQTITFDHMAFNGLVQPTLVTMDDIQAGLAGGDLTGNASLELPADNQAPTLHLDLDLQNASLLGLFTNIPPLAKVKTEAEEKAQAEDSNGKNALAPAEKRYAGVLDITFQGQGDPDSWQSFVGQGKASLSEAHLGQLHLFGGLSRLIGSLGLNFGTVDFTAARTSYTLDHAVLRMPDTRILGQTASIDANGIYNLDQDSLDFALSFHPLGAVDTPVISQLLTVLSPIANTIEVHLTGSLSDPDWSTSFGLLRAITGPRTIGEQ